MVPGVNNDTPRSERIGALGWKLLETRQAKSKAVQMYEVLNGLAPSLLAELFVLQTDNTKHDLRGPIPLAIATI